MEIITRAVIWSALAVSAFQISSASAEVKNETPEMARLYAAVKASPNHTLAVYSAYPTFPPILARFMADYPEVKAVHEVASGAPLQARLEAEKASGNYSVDVVISAPVDLTALEHQGMFQPYIPKSADSLPAGLKSKSGAISIPFRTLFSLTYNANLLPDTKVPSNLDEALNEKWRGRIGYATPTGVSAFDICAGTLWYDKILAEAQLQKLHDLGKGMPKNTDVVTNVAQGRLILGLWGPSQTAYRLQLDKAPIKVKYLKDMAVMFGPGAALLKMSPHSNAGKLFMEWLYTPKGQSAFVQEMGGFGTMPGTAMPEGFSELAQYSIKDIPIDETTDVLEQFRKVTKAIWKN